MKTLVTVLLATLLASCTIPPVSNAEKRSAIAVPAGTQSNPLQLSKVLTRIPVGETIAKMQYGWGCMPGMVLGWPGGRLAVSDQSFSETFKRELEQLRYAVVGDPDSVFESAIRSPAQLQVGATISKVEANLCFPFSGSPNLSVGNTDSVKGAVFMRIAWELYSPAQAKVIFKSTTDGAFQTDQTIVGGLPAIFLKAFAANINNLAADPEFHRLVITPPSPPMIPPSGART
jgi:serine protease Do